MRHRKKINSLGRKAAHRKKTMSNMASSLILHKRITTTLAKAKALRIYVEPLITKSKEDSTHSRRTVFSYLRNKYAVSELFREVSQKVADRPGGYTRILKTGFRKGDGAEMCFIELVDYNTHMLHTEEDTQQKRTRRGRRRGKSADGQETEAVAEKPREEDPAAAAELPTEESVDAAEKQLTETPEVAADSTESEKTADAEAATDTETQTEAELKAEKVEEEPKAEADSQETDPQKDKDSEEEDKDKEAGK